MATILFDIHPGFKAAGIFLSNIFIVSVIKINTLEKLFFQCVLLFYALLLLKPIAYTAIFIIIPRRSENSKNNS